MKNKLFILAGALLASSSVYAAEEVAVFACAGYNYSGPNYSGYYNYPMGAPYNYTGPNYRGYYNYPIGAPYNYSGPNYSGYYNYPPDVCVGVAAVEVVVTK